MNTPNLYTPEQLKDWPMSVHIGNSSVSARPMGFQGIFLRRRLYFAWMVFTGKWDALQWHGQPDAIRALKGGE